MNIRFDITAWHLENYNAVFLIANVVAVICTTLVIAAILLDFVHYHRPRQSKRKVNSWVETGSMFVYFFIYLLLMKPAFGRLDIQSELLLGIIQVSGMILLIAGCYVNIKGRLILKHNWANQVTIYHNHALITTSVYRWVRHPLYASLIWMLAGGSLIYQSYLALLSVFVIFLPMMCYRAKQEEKLLIKEFPEYSQYKQRTGMLFPR
ncbi:isoprenylcysteine carboxyl methyltransferase [Bacteroidia bacterium]|nr:isoprenylcysteine carboxyl methyltransferase [Bacteroidia bacterium]